MNQSNKNNEYVKFWGKFAKNADDILQEYNKLSPENRQRARMDAQRIFALQGIEGILKFAKNL